MKPSCPKCAPYPKVADWPKLGESVGGYRTCPVCRNKFNDKLQIVTSHKKKKEIQDPSNPGEYMTRLCRQCKQDVPMHSMKLDPRNSTGLANICKSCHNENEKKRNRLKRQYPTWSEDAIFNAKIYDIAFKFGQPPGVVRGIIELWNE